MKTKLKQWLASGLLVAWAASVSAVLVPMMGWHTIALPVHADYQAAKADSPAPGQWCVVHCFAAGCPCSEAVFSQLKSLNAEPEEYFLLLGDDDDLRQRLSESRLLPWPDALSTDDLGVTGGPWMVIISPQEQVVYSGGYSDYPPSRLRPLDTPQIVQTAMAGKLPRRRPAFGCATRQEIKSTLDPLMLK